MTGEELQAELEKLYEENQDKLTPVTGGAKDWAEIKLKEFIDQNNGVYNAALASTYIVNQKALIDSIKSDI